MIKPTLPTFLKLVEYEVQAAREQFPSNKHQLAALTEEVGELAMAMLDHDRGDETSHGILLEAVQVAAMAARVAIEGDESFKYNNNIYTERDLSKRGESY